MQESLVVQSRTLLNKLSENKSKIQTNIKDINTIQSNQHSSNLLNDPFNLREYATKHSLKDSLPNRRVDSIISRSGYLSRTRPKSNIVELTPKPQKPSINNIDLLGYDWIAGMMDNCSKESQLDHSTEFYEELDRFRRNNKKLCCSNQESNSSALLYSTIPRQNIKMNISKYQEDTLKVLSSHHETQINNHLKPEINQNINPPIYSYTLNERLFPIPLDLETAERPPSDMQNPHIIKISVPSSRFLHPKITNRNVQGQLITRTNQKQEYNEPIGESLSLQSHCGPYKQYALMNSNNNALISTNHSLVKPCQEPAGLKAQLALDRSSMKSSQRDWLDNTEVVASQPQTETEAIAQLTRGKIAARFSRSVPSELSSRIIVSADSDIPEILPSTNIWSARIARDELSHCLDESLPRQHPPSSDGKLDSNQVPKVLFNDCAAVFSNDCPTYGISRENMSQVYCEAFTRLSAST